MTHIVSIVQDSKKLNLNQTKPMIESLKQWIRWQDKVSKGGGGGKEKKTIKEHLPKQAANIA